MWKRHLAALLDTGLDTRLGNNCTMAKTMRPGLISREHAKAMADAGTIIGVWTHLVDSPTEYVQAIREMVDVAGIDHVCIGTDTKLTPGGGPDRRGKKEGGPGPGERRQRPGERTNLAWADQKFGFYYTVVDEMLKQGFTPDEIRKVGGGNFCRAFDAATAGRA